MKPQIARGRNRCTSAKTDGKPCRAYAQRGEDTCIFHSKSPDAIDRSQQARARGGRNSARLSRAMKRMPDDLRAVYDRLAHALDDVHVGNLEPNRATAMAALARAMVTVLDSAETLRRLESIESLLECGDPLQLLGYEEVGT